jgi:polyhydroxyalkanoate synthase
MSQQTENMGMNLPNPADMAKTYAEVAQRASRLITQYMEKKVKEGVNAPSDELGVAKAFMDLSSRLMANPYKMAQTQMNMMWDYFSLWQGSSMKMMGMPTQSPIAAPKKGDNRFKDEEWEEHFLFDFIKQSYLITARHLHDTVSRTEGLDENTQQKVNFFTRQYIDALSPSNFAMTNPEVFRETVKSHGQNLIKGLNNLLHDVEDGDGQLRIRMTDTSAFRDGQERRHHAGQGGLPERTDPADPVRSPDTGQYKKPLLIVPPWINKYYILDLRDKNSMVKWAPTRATPPSSCPGSTRTRSWPQKTFEDYVLEGSIAAINQVCAADRREASTWPATAWAARCHDDAGLHGGQEGQARQFGHLLHHHARLLRAGRTGRLPRRRPGLRPRKEDGRARLPRRFGNGRHLQHAARQRPDLVLRGQQLPDGQGPVPVRPAVLELGLHPHAGAMHSFYLRNMYLGNKLREPGGITLGGVKIDISKVKTPCYFISTIEDHIAPWKSTYMGARLPSGPTKFVLGGSGHIAGIVNPPAANKYGYWTKELISIMSTAAASAYSVPDQGQLGQGRPLDGIEQVFDQQAKFGIAGNLKFAVEEQGVGVFLAGKQLEIGREMGGKGEVGFAHDTKNRTEHAISIGE